MTVTGTRRSFLDVVASISDGAILRTAFYALLAGTMGVLWLDYTTMSEQNGTGLATTFEPVLPAFDPDSPQTAPGPGVTTDFETLKQPLTITLGTGGTLNVSGTIDPGAAARFAAEVESRGEYVTTVAFDSPGGSVTDAMEIGRLIRDRGYATRVAAGALCASSCPLAYAGGTTREASPASAIGVHQIYAAVASNAVPTGIQAAGAAMSEAQRTTAVITRHLTGMGVDPALWLHALETPPDRLYYLSPDEMVALALVTALDPPPAS